MKKIDEFEKVRIINNGMIGTVVDISKINGDNVYLIESNTKTYDIDGNIEYKIYDCKDGEIEPIDK